MSMLMKKAHRREETRLANTNIAAHTTTPTKHIVEASEATNHSKAHKPLRGHHCRSRLQPNESQPGIDATILSWMRDPAAVTANKAKQLSRKPSRG